MAQTFFLTPGRHVGWLLPCMLILLAPSDTLARKPDTRPRPGFLFADTQTCIVQDGWNSLGLYDLQSGKVIHDFQIEGSVKSAIVTADAELLLVSWDAGNVDLWRIKTGQRLWQKNLGHGHIYDMDFAHDGRSFIVGGNGGNASVFDTLTGTRTHLFDVADEVRSVALSPDGSQGAFVKRGGDLHRFSLMDGILPVNQPIDIGHIRFSADGKFFLYTSKMKVLVLILEKNWDLSPRVTDEVDAWNIKALQDGSFRIIGGQRDGGRMGMRYWPETGKSETVAVNRTRDLVDFDPRAMLALENAWTLEAKVIDLRTGNVLLTLDNSDKRTPLRRNLLHFLMGAVVFLFVVLFLGIFLRMLRSRHSPLRQES